MDGRETAVKKRHLGEWIKRKREREMDKELKGGGEDDGLGTQEDTKNC